MSDFERAMAKLRAVVADEGRPALAKISVAIDQAHDNAIESYMEEVRQLRGEVELGRQARQQLGSLRAELAAARVQIQTVLDRESHAYYSGQGEAYRRLGEWAREREAMARQQAAQVPSDPALTTLTAGTNLCTCIQTENATGHRPANAACALTRAKRRAEGTVMA